MSAKPTAHVADLQSVDRHEERLLPCTDPCQGEEWRCSQVGRPIRSSPQILIRPAHSDLPARPGLTALLGSRQTVHLIY